MNIWIIDATTTYGNWFAIALYTWCFSVSNYFPPSIIQSLSDCCIIVVCSFSCWLLFTYNITTCLSSGYEEHSISRRWDECADCQCWPTVWPLASQQCLIGIKSIFFFGQKLEVWRILSRLTWGADMETSHIISWLHCVVPCTALFNVLLQNSDQVVTSSQRDERICTQLDSLDSSASWLLSSYYNSERSCKVEQRFLFPWALNWFEDNGCRFTLHAGITSFAVFSADSVADITIFHYVSIRLVVFLALLHYIWNWKVVLQGLLQSTCRMFMGRSLPPRALHAPLPAAASKLTEARAANGTTRATETDYVLRLGAAYGNACA